MISLGFEKKIVKIVMNVIDKTIGKKFPIIDKITDMFQEQDHKMQELERKIDAIESVLKEENQ